MNFTMSFMWNSTENNQLQGKQFEHIFGWNSKFLFLPNMMTQCIDLLRNVQDSSFTATGNPLNLVNREKYLFSFCKGKKFQKNNESNKIIIFFFNQYFYSFIFLFKESTKLIKLEIHHSSVVFFSALIVSCFLSFFLSFSIYVEHF